MCLVKHRYRILLAVSVVLASAGVPDRPAFAQYSGQANSDNLQDALRRIAIDSNDSSALADAGLAALEMGDMRAAIGFLAKADQIYSKSGRVKAGLGRALLAEENPFGAIRYFDQAVENGIAAREIAASAMRFHWGSAAMSSSQKPSSIHCSRKAIGMPGATGRSSLP